MKVSISNAKFQELHNRFQNSAGNAEGPVLVLYYRINDIVCAYMKFSGVCWKTELSVENAGKYLSMFNAPIEVDRVYGE